MKKDLIKYFILLFIFMNFKTYGGGFSNLDLGSIRAGMFGIVAGVDDPSAIFHNPAALSDQKGQQLYYSELFAVVHTYIRLYYPDGSKSEKIKPDLTAGTCPYIAYTNDFNKEKWTAGVALYFPNFYGAFMPEDAPTRYYFVRAYFVTGYLTAAGAYKINDKLSVGGGLSYIYVLLDAFRHNGDPYQYRDKDPDEDYKLYVSGKDSNFNFSLGLLYKPSKKIKLGLSFTSKTTVKLEGYYRIKDPEGNTVLDDSQTTEVPIPTSVRAGIYWDINSLWAFSFDYSWWDYSVYKEQVTKTKSGIVIVVPKNYHDSHNIGFGFKRKISKKFSLMFGLQYDWSPIPLQYYTIDNPTTDLYGFSIGGIYFLSKNTRLAFAYVRNEYKRIEIKNSKTFPPTNGEGRGRNNELSVDVLYRF